MEEIEVPTEHLHEEMHHHAEHGGNSWNMGAALSSALLAAFAAVTALLAGHHANESMLEQLKASDQWAYYQSKGIKSNVLATKLDLLKAMGHRPSKGDEEKLAEYKKEQEEISKEASELQESSHAHLKHHVILARGVTMFQVAIAIGAIAVLTRKKPFWHFSMVLGAVGVVFFVQGLL